MTDQKPEAKEEPVIYAIPENDTSDYYGVDPVYAAYGNKTDKPVWTDEEKKLLGLDKSDEEKEKAEAQKSSTTPAFTGSVTGGNQSQSKPSAPAAPAAPK